MADTKTTALTENTAPLGSDLEYMIDDPAGTPASHKIYKGSNNLLPDGHMLNGTISVTVAANNITVALKTKSGGDPSATDPVSVWINGTYRRCTAATSATLNAGTNYFNCGGTELATKAVPFFAYLVWNTQPATDLVAITFGRRPDFRLVSDTSSTNTAITYVPGTFTATDDMTCVGYFEATLSAGAGYTWSVAAWTSLNKRDVPTTESRWMDYTITHLASGGNYTNAPTTNRAKYKIAMGRMVLDVKFTYNATSGGTTYSRITIPYLPASDGVPFPVINVTAGITNMGLVDLTSTGYIYIYKYDGTSPITNSQVITVCGQVAI